MADVPKTWPLNGYAPGNYMCRCVSCKQQFQGDKRAYQCLDCAVRQVQSLLSALLSERERRTAQEVTVPESDRLTAEELSVIFGDEIPMLAVKIIFPEKSEPLTTNELRYVCRLIAQGSAERWRTMDTAPRDGKHCILAVPDGSGFIYSVRGAFINGKWMNAADIDGEPLYWMPNVRLPAAPSISTSAGDDSRG